jgi:putative oxidoreductase
MSVTKEKCANGAAWLAAAAFGLAGAMKLADPARFAADIVNYRLVGPEMAGVAAVYLPWLELTLAAGLVVSPWRRVAAWLALGLVIGFSGALGAAAARGLDVSCGCFGRALDSSIGWALARNAGLAGLLWIASRGQKQEAPRI